MRQGNYVIGNPSHQGNFVTVDTYLKVVWHHDFPDEPVVLFSELDDERYETRKVEVFRDGHRTFASLQGFSGSTMLGEIPAPSIEELSESGEFSPEQIAREEFEAIWVEAISAQE